MYGHKVRTFKKFLTVALHRLFSIEKYYSNAEAISYQKISFIFLSVPPSIVCTPHIFILGVFFTVLQINKRKYKLDIGV